MARPKHHNLCDCGNEKRRESKRCMDCKRKHVSDMLKGRNYWEREPVEVKTHSNLTMHKYLQQPLIKRG